VNVATISRLYGIDIWQRYGEDLTPYVAAGLLVHEPGRRIALTRRGMLLANEVMAVFIDRTVRYSSDLSLKEADRCCED
jgi:hypothetical protein